MSSFWSSTRIIILSSIVKDFVKYSVQAIDKIIITLEYYLNKRFKPRNNQVLIRVGKVELRNKAKF